MFCWNCGKEIPDTSKFCPYCAKQQGQATDDAADKAGVTAASVVAAAVAASAAAAQPGTPSTSTATAQPASGAQSALSAQPGTPSTSAAAAQPGTPSTYTASTRVGVTGPVGMTGKSDRLPGPTIVNPAPGTPGAFGAAQPGSPGMPGTPEPPGMPGAVQPGIPGAPGMQGTMGSPGMPGALGAPGASGTPGAAQPGYAAAAQSQPGFQRPPYGGGQQVQPPYAGGQQPYAGGQGSQPPYGASGYQAGQPAGYQANRYGGQAAHYSTQPPYYGAQPVAKKRTSKAPFIIIGAVLLVLIVGGVAVFASGILGNLFAPKSMMSALYQGTENLFYDTSSGTMELRISDGSIDAVATVKWDFGDDLKSSVIWVDAYNSGFVLKDDKVIIYQSTGSVSDIKITGEYAGFVDLLNQTAGEMGVSDVDFNNIVKNGKLDRNYLEQLNQKLAKADSGSEYLGLEARHSELITEIINDFMNTEVNKSKVRDKFMSDSYTESSGGVTTYSANVNLKDFVNALGDYAYQRGRDAKYALAADEVVDACDSYISNGLGAELTLEDLSVVVTVKNNILTGLMLVFSTSSESFSITVDITGLNTTELDSDHRITNIINSPRSYSGNGSGNGGNLTNIF